MTTIRPPATGLVLAGGRAARFGRDKLIEPVEGVPLVERAIAAVARVCDEVVLVVPPERVSVASYALGGPSTVRVVHDPEPFGGPLVGLLAGLEQAAQPLALVVAGDMPFLEEGVLALLLRTLAAGDSDAVALLLRGRRQQVPIAVRVGKGTDAARRQLGAGDRRLGSVLDLLLVHEIPEGEWRGLDPEGRTLVDVDRPEDLR